MHIIKGTLISIVLGTLLLSTAGCGGSTNAVAGQDVTACLSTISDTISSTEPNVASVVISAVEILIGCVQLAGEVWQTLTAPSGSASAGSTTSAVQSAVQLSLLQGVEKTYPIPQQQLIIDNCHSSTDLNVPSYTVQTGINVYTSTPNNATSPWDSVVYKGIVQGAHLHPGAYDYTLVTVSAHVPAHMRGIVTADANVTEVVGQLNVTLNKNPVESATWVYPIRIHLTPQPDLTILPC